jgi:energy-coupling factor transporter ATP-binding protein EcfA2
MKTFDIEVENLGPIKKGKIETSLLNVICGPNNSGKSFLLHTFYAFLKNSFASALIPLESGLEDWVKAACSRSVVTIHLSDFQSKINNYIRNGMPNLLKILPSFLSRQPSLFNSTKIAVTLSDDWIAEFAGQDQNFTIQVTGDCTCQFSKRRADLTLNFHNKGEKFPPEKIIKENIEFAIKIALLFPLVRNVLLATSERTGATMFADFVSVSNRAGNLIQDQGLLPLLAPPSPFSAPHRDELTRLSSSQLKVNFKRNGLFTENRYRLLHTLLHDIVKGRYRMDDMKGLRFIPDATNMELEMAESSSSVRMFMEIDFIIRHMLDPFSTLLIDEPELNLTPDNQRRMARLLVQLARDGVQVFITTHSDYIVREINTLVAFHKQTEHTKKIAQKFGYAEDEHIAPDDVALYYIKKPEQMKSEDENVFERITLNGDFSVEIPPFDDSIREMADIQTELSWED